MPISPCRKIIALIYDFDGTLSPQPMQEYTVLPKIGVDPAEFWAEVNEEARTTGAEPIITYMRLMYEYADRAKIAIDRTALGALAARVQLYQGVAEWFDLINARTRQGYDVDITLRHYIISSGLHEILEGVSIYNRFHNVFASSYHFDHYGRASYPKQVITDTTKTQYLFRINKGLEDPAQDINRHMPDSERPVPFRNMIYFGDGMTDVPSMAVTRQYGGFAMAVHPPGGDETASRALLEAGRIDFFAPADFREGKPLHTRTELILDHIISRIRIDCEKWRLFAAG